MKMKTFFFGTLLIGLLSFHQNSSAQCTWSTYLFDSFEYTTVIPHMIPGMCYQNTPQTFAGCVRSGSRGMYLNIIDGQIGLLYSRPVTDLCIGRQYRISFSVRDAWTSSNNFTFNVYDANNVIIQTLTVITNSVWQDITMPIFTATTSSIKFDIVTNLAGGPGNDGGFDDFGVSVCNPTTFNTSSTQCNVSNAVNLLPLISGSNLSAAGTWTGPSALQNGAQGTFQPGTNTNGIYTYSISNGLNCTDSIANITVNYINTPVLDSIGPVFGCGSVVLPAITGANLTGQQKYYSQPNGTGITYLPGATITTSQTLYAFDGFPNCNDQFSLSVTVEMPGNAGNNNAASYCGGGLLISLPTMLSTNASPAGLWSEISAIPSGSFNTSTGVFNTNSITPGVYDFTYTIPSTANCPVDSANFTISIGTMPPVFLGNDTSLCVGQSLVLNAGNYDNYLWNNGSTAATRTITTSGTYSVRVGTLGSNQIINGNFESGATGFTTSYIPGNGGAYGLLSNPGTYAISSSPNLTHVNFVSCQDVTPAPGTNMFIVNGSSLPNTSVWCQTIPVQPNTGYQFGTYVASAITGTNVAQLQFSINNSTLGPAFSPSTNGCVWNQFAQTWNSGMTTTAQICIVNQNTSSGGNDFMLDEITFRPICYKYDTIVVNFSPLPVVNLGADQQLCIGTPVTLDAGNPAFQFTWNTSDSTQQIIVDSAGTYSVTVTNSIGCIGTDAVNISYQELKTAGLDSSILLCSTLPTFQLTNLLSTNADIGGYWITNNFSGVVAPTGQVNISGQTGIYDFSYVVPGILCPNDTSTFVLNIFNQPVAQTNASIHLCNTPGTTIDLSNYFVHPSNPNGGSWNIGSTLSTAVFDTTTANLQLGLLPHGFHTLTYILGADSPCVQDTFTLSIQITQVPDVAFLPSVESGCQPLQVTFENQSVTQGNVVYTWDFGNGVQSTTPSGFTTTYTTPICYDVTLTVTADNLCTTTYTGVDEICVYPIPTASFTYGPQQVYSDGPTVEFDNTSIFSATNFWVFGDGTNSQAVHPVHTFPIGEIGNYLVQLFVVSPYGCTDSTSQLIAVKDQPLYYVPNSFTPDNNTFNNVFLPQLTAGFIEETYHLVIYNRWGEQIFESKDLTIGWDGTYKGKEVPEGTYTWKIRAALSERDEILELIGSVNLLR